jgi:hypothetical protein
MDGPAKYAAIALGIAIVAAVALGFTLTQGSPQHASDIVPVADAATAPVTAVATTAIATSSTAPAPAGTTANATIVQVFTSTMRTYVNHDPEPAELADFVTEFHNEELAYNAAKAAGKSAKAPRLEAVANTWITNTHAAEILAVQTALAQQRAAVSAAQATSPGGEVAGQARR